MLGLLAEPDAVAAKAIVASGVSLDAVRDAAVAALPAAATATDDLVPYDEAASKALEVTFREALRLGHNYIGTEHILLALLETEPEGGPLAAAGVDKAAVDEQVVVAPRQVQWPSGQALSGSSVRARSAAELLAAALLARADR